MKIERILVPLDGSKLAEQALPFARTLARASNASIAVVAVVPEVVFFDASGVSLVLARELEATVAHLRSYVDARVDELTKDGFRANGSVSVDVPVAGILEACRSGRADLVVMTTHGRGGFRRAVLGSVSDAFVRRSPVPVIMLRPDDQLRQGMLKESGIRKILVPLDGSAEAESALEPATALARAFDATVTLLVVMEPPALLSTELAPLGYEPVILFEKHEAATRYLDSVAPRLRHAGVNVVTLPFSEAPVALAITRYARENAMDLIVMSSHGRSGFRRLMLGSVADRVMHHADVPVLIARAATTEKITRPDHHEAWQRDLIAFTVRNRHKPVNIEIDSPDVGVQREVEGLGLIGIDYEWHDDRLSIALEGDAGAHLIHRIMTPDAVHVLAHAAGETLAIQHDGGQTLLHVANGAQVRTPVTDGASRKEADTDRGPSPTPALVSEIHV